MKNMMKNIRLLVGSLLVVATCVATPVRSEAKPCAQHRYKMCGGGECPDGQTCYSTHKSCVCKPTKEQPHHTRASATPRGAAAPTQ